MDFRDSQPRNSASLRLATVEGIVILVRDLQFLKAPLPIFFNPSDSSTLDKLVQPLKTRSSILVTDSGISIASSPTQSENALSPRTVRLWGKLIVFKLLQLLNTPP